MLARNIHPTWEIHFVGDTKHIQDTETIQYGLVGGFFTPLNNITVVKLDHLPRVRGEHKKYLKPPPSIILLYV